MSDNLLPQIEESLDVLERELIEKFMQAQYKAEIADIQYVRLPLEQGRHLLGELKNLRDQLIATGDTSNLQLVTDFHDELRIRIIYLSHLLDRDIPYAYLEKSLAELKEYAPPKVQQTARPTNALPEEAAPKETGGLFGTLMGLFSGKEKEKEAPAARPSPVRPVDLSKVSNEATGQEASDPRPRLANGKLMPEPLQRVIMLHHYMEEDKEQLVKEGQQIPKLSEKIKLPSAITEFLARDLGGNLLRQKNKRPFNGTARTPEELRRKLEEREKYEK